MGKTPPKDLAYPRQLGKNYDYRCFPQDQEFRANAIIEQFRFAMDGYFTFAFPHDELRPLNNSFANQRNGWGVTAFDALDTAIIMEQQDIVDKILDFIPIVNFTQTMTEKPSVVSLFETNIRYLAGMLSSYDLLKGPFSHMAQNKPTEVDALLTQAKYLADQLKFAFNTDSGIPVNRIFFNNHTFSEQYKQDDGVYTAGLAELGSLQIEWQHLSDLTGDPEYGDLVQKAESYFFNPVSQYPGVVNAEPFPGLTGGNFSTKTGKIIDDYGGWVSGNDSAYEYLIKMYVYDPDRYANYSDMFTKAADSTMANLTSHPSSRPDLTMVQTFAGTKTQNYSQQLACFIGGSYLLGSSALNRPDWKEFGLELSEFCANGYRYAPAGIGPPEYSWDTDLLASNFSNQTAFYEKAGWYIPENGEFDENGNENYGNGEAPEAVESWYYAYQVTEDQYWRDVAWAYVIAQNTTERVGTGFSSLLDVFKTDGGGTQNFMASFMLAEVFKYQYMIQKEGGGIWNVMGGPDKTNLFVYNTECHPMRVTAKKPV